MIKHTFLDKCCTIVKDSDLNTGLNPVAELNYGNCISRVLIHFDVEELQMMIEDKTFSNLDSLTHILKLTNCGSVNNDLHNKTLTSGCEPKERASSFTVLLFKVPYEWDNGKGIDFANDFWISDHHKFSNSGCNWFQRKNGQPWDTEGIISQHDLFLESMAGAAKSVVDYFNNNIDLFMRVCYNCRKKENIPKGGQLFEFTAHEVRGRGRETWLSQQSGGNAYDTQGKRKR